MIVITIAAAAIAGAIGGVVAVEFRQWRQRRRFVRELTKAFMEGIDKPGNPSAAPILITDPRKMWENRT